LVSVVAEDSVVAVEGVVAVDSVEVVVLIVLVVAVLDVSSTTFGCSVDVVVDSAGCSSFLQAPRNRNVEAVAARRVNVRNFFISRSPFL
jgi:hypothetical protein